MQGQSNIRYYPLDSFNLLIYRRFLKSPVLDMDPCLRHHIFASSSDICLNFRWILVNLTPLLFLRFISIPSITGNGGNYHRRRPERSPSIKKMPARAEMEPGQKKISRSVPYHFTTTAPLSKKFRRGNISEVHVTSCQDWKSPKDNSNTGGLAHEDPKSPLIRSVSQERF